MEYTRKNRGTCSRQTHVVIEDGIVKDIEIKGGCNGNLKGIRTLITGMRAEDVVKKLKGTKCGFRNTSCPDQIALCIEEALANS
jgi:uncharacterized protein (TIGR03905 family)